VCRRLTIAPRNSFAEHRGVTGSAPPFRPFATVDGSRPERGMITPPRSQSCGRNRYWRPPRGCRVLIEVVDAAHGQAIVRNRWTLF
jgi:hypothetical protein